MRKLRFVAAALILLVAASLPVVSDRLVQSLEQTQPRLSIRECPPADAVVVLGGLVSGWDGSTHAVEYSDAVDRLEAAVQLMLAEKARRLILGGGGLEYIAGNKTEADAMLEAAVARGVPREAVTVLRNVSVTADEIRATIDLKKQLSLKRVILVTSAFHMPRALYLLGATGTRCDPVPG